MLNIIIISGAGGCQAAGSDSIPGGTRYQRFLQPGDAMQSTIEGLGTQRTPCVAKGD